MKFHTKKAILLYAVLLSLSLASCGDSRYQEYTIMWVAGYHFDRIVVKRGDLPKCPWNEDDIASWVDDSQYSYTFVGWTPEVQPAYEDARYEATFDIKNVKTYTVTWMYDDETVILEDEWEYGSTPVYRGETPTKSSDARYTYTFSHWEAVGGSREEGPIERNRKYVARFKSTINEYKITWVDYDDSVLRVDTLPYGTKPSYDGEKPFRERDAQYTYAFKGWEPGIEFVTGDATYKAVYKCETNKYEITWKDYDGSTLKVAYLAYGDLPSYGEDPKREVKPSDEMPYEGWAFDGWYPEVEEVTGDATYTAKYVKKECDEFTIWFNANGGTGGPEKQTKRKGETLRIEGQPSRKGYYFYGWNNLYSNLVYQNYFGLDINLTMYAMWVPLCPDCGGTGDSSCKECDGCGWFCSYCNEPYVAINDIKYYGNYNASYGYCSSCGQKVYENRWSGSNNKLVLDARVMCTACKGKGYLGSKRVCDVKYVYEDAPECKNVTATTIRLVTDYLYEYSIDGENYQESGLFDGLSPNTTYTFYRRRKASNGVPFGVPSNPASITTAAAD